MSDDARPRCATHELSGRSRHAILCPMRPGHAYLANYYFDSWTSCLRTRPNAESTTYREDRIACMHRALSTPLAHERDELVQGGAGKTQNHVESTFATNHASHFYIGSGFSSYPCHVPPWFTRGSNGYLEWNHGREAWADDQRQPVLQQETGDCRPSLLSTTSMSSTHSTPRQMWPVCCCSHKQPSALSSPIKTFAYIWHPASLNHSLSDYIIPSQQPLITHSSPWLSGTLGG
jgi:hypothetical protein